MFPRIRRALSLGFVLLVLIGAPLAMWWWWPKQNFTLPNGRQITLEKITWRPDNRFPLSGATPLLDLVNRAAAPMKFQPFPNLYFGLGTWPPGAVWVGAEIMNDLNTVELRLVHDGIESAPVKAYRVPPFGGEPPPFSYLPLPPLPRDGRQVLARLYHRPSKHSEPTMFGQFVLEPQLAANPSFNRTAFDAAQAGTNELMTVSVVDWQIAEGPVPTNVLDRSLLRLQIREHADPTLVATNWDIGSVTVENSLGDTVEQHVDNRDYTNGVLRAGLRPMWLDGQPYRLRIGLVRNRNYPASNHIHFGPLYPSTALSPSPVIMTKVFGSLITARLDIGRFDNPVPTVTNWQVSLMVDASGSYQAPPRHVRWVRLTDQRGTNYNYNGSSWGSDLFRFNPTQETNFLDGTVTSVDAVISWEPIVTVDVLATPRAATNFADWPQKAAKR